MVASSDDAKTLPGRASRHCQTCAPGHRADDREVVDIADVDDSRIWERDTVPTVLSCDADTLDWKETVRRLRRSDCPKPLVFLTRLPDERLWVEMLDAGVFDLLQKPCRARNLCWVVETALKHYLIIPRRPAARANYSPADLSREGTAA